MFAAYFIFRVRSHVEENFDFVHLICIPQRPNEGNPIRFIGTVLGWENKQPLSERN